MNLDQFLDRIVAPGNWIALAYKGQSFNGMAHRFYPRTNVADAASYLRWLAPKSDTWFAMASFEHAELHSNGKKYTGKRNRENAQQLKTFWADADISRPGDGKDPASVFADEAEVVRWVAGFTKLTGIPKPNLWIKSGYGLHLYWSFEDSLDIATWHSYAEALKATLMAHAFKGDVGVTADAVRILRPPETMNHKVPGQPVHCYEFMPNKLTAPDYATADLTAALSVQPAYHIIKTTSRTKAPTTTGSGNTSTANAKAGLHAAPRDFQSMVADCPQMKASFDTRGEHDGREIWWRMVQLAQFSDNGRYWAHEISDAHPKYTQADTDIEFDRAVYDNKTRGFGPPTCREINTVAANTPRKDTCKNCPHWQTNVTTPFHLGLVAASPTTGSGTADELPTGWRRQDGWIEGNEPDKSGKLQWLRAVEGDITDLILSYVDQHYRLTFTYTLPYQPDPGIQPPPDPHPPRRVYVDDSELTIRALRAALCTRGMAISEGRAPRTSRLLMSWIDKLQREIRVHGEPAPSFGWYRDRTGVLGFSAGGRCYLVGGGEAQAPGADHVLISRYTPRGVLSEWKAAAEFIIGTSPELHTTVAVAFAAPLMELQGGSGAVLSFVGKSGVGKTSATRAGQAVWADPIGTVLSVDDTTTYKGLAIGQVRSMPIYWDEAKADDEIKKLIHEIHTFTQGRDKGRGTAAVTMRTPGEWSTIYSISTNDSIRDLITSHHGDTEATLLRMLEIRVERQITYNPQADKVESSLRDNRGTAGVEYARYLADNIERIKTTLVKTKDLLYQRLQPTNDERFYIATMAAIIVGAKIAKRLGLINLDIDGITKVLSTSIEGSRGMRQEETPIDPQDKMVRHLSDFLTAYQHECVITEFFKTSGPGPKPQVKFQPQNAPKEGLGIAYHIGMDEKIIRINQNVWRKYWNGRVISPTNLRKQISARWGAPVLRGLGYGTQYVAPGAYTFCLYLNDPALEMFLDHWQSVTTGSGGAKVIALPNRPKV